MVTAVEDFTVVDRSTLRTISVAQVFACSRTSETEVSGVLVKEVYVLLAQVAHAVLVDVYESVVTSGEQGLS